MLGLITGAFLGYGATYSLQLGLLGAFVGGYIGKKFDLGMIHHKNQESHADIDRFYEVCFLVMGCIAKADGKVCEQKVTAYKQIIRMLSLNKVQTKKANKAFYHGVKEEPNIKTNIAKIKPLSISNDKVKRSITNTLITFTQLFPANEANKTRLNKTLQLLGVILYEPVNDINKAHEILGTNKKMRLKYKIQERYEFIIFTI